MNIIKLDQHTTNLIAAGEVIERAASVVKELVENSIDAQATKINIRLVDSGLLEITVSDNGTGMDATDARMCVLPHATSKIKDGKDLFRISTLGFRGEALPSIVAVSNFKLKTSDDGLRGMMYSLKAGEIVSEAMIAFPKGTEITVKNLFFNTPARLQNLQSQSIELSYVVDFVSKIALSRPDISFKLTNNDKVMLSTYGNNRLLEVIMNVYGEDVAKEMVEIFENDGYFKVSGFISKTNISRSTKNHINVIVNNRTIKNYKIVNAVVEAYKGRYLNNRYPICVINIVVDPSLVDVNVHPAKLEVRFSNEEALLDLIKKGIVYTLSQTNMIMDDDNEDNHDNFEQDFEEEEHEKKNLDSKINVNPNPNQNQESKPSYDSKIDNEILEENETVLVKEKEPIFEGLKIEDFETDNQETVYYHQEENLVTKEEKPAENYEQQSYSLNKNEKIGYSTSKLPKLYFIGQLHGTYLLFQDQDNFYLIDQHAAFERINYEKIKHELANEQVIIYELLVPINLQFTPSEAILISEKVEEINKLGIIIEDFGGGTYTVRQVPIWFIRGQEKDYAEEIINKVINNKEADKQIMQDNLAKSLACKKSIKANQFLDATLIDYLLDDLGKCENPYNCPHGRPVIVRFPITDIEKWFKRIV